jgi:hypothetical protein
MTARAQKKEYQNSTTRLMNPIIRAASKEFLAEIKNVPSDDGMQFLANIEIVSIAALAMFVK